jgi:16S rRNA C967 or C1407 C5-methylase (RsmB/RsmF family)
MKYAQTRMEYRAGKREKPGQSFTKHVEFTRGVFIQQEQSSDVIHQVQQPRPALMP